MMLMLHARGGLSALVPYAKALHPRLAHPLLTCWLCARHNARALAFGGKNHTSALEVLETTLQHLGKLDYLQVDQSLVGHILRKPA